jgi:uracil-DNA glycosylase
MLESISKCQKCDLYEKAGVNVPYIGSQAKYVIIGESPTNGKLLLDRNKSDFWELLTNYGLRKVDFGIIHSIQCYAKRPSEYHRDACRP